MPNSNRATILIFDNDPEIVGLAARLELAGYRVLITTTTDASLQALSGDKVDLILVDCGPPGRLGGLEFYARVKAAGYDIPFIMVTRVSSEATVILALRAGVRDFITKTDGYLDYLPNAVARVLGQVQTERQLKSIIIAAKDAIIGTGPDRRITLFNPAAEAMFRCRAAEAIGQPLARFIPMEYDSNRIGSDVGDGDTSPSVLVREGRWGLRADGDRFPLESSFSRSEVGGRRIHSVVVRDMTERHQLEERFRQSQRMEAIGQLAGGIAHDFNNLLTVISGFTEMVLAGLQSEDPSREMLEEIHKAGERAALLTRQLLTFSRKEVVEPKILDLNTVIEGSCKMLRRLIGEDIRLATEPASKLDRIKADSGHLEQVIMNLAVNARDAMPTGGRLTIETANIEFDEEYAQAHAGVKSGRFVLLAVHDTGCGMTENVKNKIFEPFFTTKGKAKGTGLGLATVYGIVQQSRGYIEVTTELGHGTTFKIYFPSAGPAVSSGELTLERQAIPSGSGKVLLVEDDDSVRRMARHSLQMLGYEVLEARGGDEALRICDSYQEEIDLLLTDVVMPGMSGPQVADAIGKMRSGIKVLYMSGYTDDEVLRHGIRQSEAAFLQKPFTQFALASKVREVLRVTQSRSSAPELHVGSPSAVSAMK